MLRTKHVTVVEPYLEGHRSQQLLAIREILAEANVGVNHYTKLWPHGFSGSPLLFPTVDGLFLQFYLVALVRCIVGLRTVAIWHRPKYSALNRNLKSRLKYIGAYVLKSLPFVSILSVQAPDFETSIKHIVTDWIYQVAQWSRPKQAELALIQNSLLLTRIRNHAGGRSVLAFLGEITLQKGFEFFVNLACSGLVNKDNITFAAAGKLTKDCTLLSQRLVDGGGLLIDEYLTDSEFLGCLEFARWVWICYTPENDQNSGIFGLAYQTGSEAIVRAGSYIACEALQLQYPVLAVAYGNIEGAADLIVQSSTSCIGFPERERIVAMKAQTSKKLLYYLGVSK